MMNQWEYCYVYRDHLVNKAEDKITDVQEWIYVCYCDDSYSGGVRTETISLKWKDKQDFHDNFLDPDKSISGIIAKLGKEGWEMFSIPVVKTTLGNTGPEYWFKRRINEESPHKSSWLGQLISRDKK